MTDSPNLALAEEIERTIYRIEKLRSIRRGPTVELTNMEYDRIIAALRAQPSGDWVMVPRNVLDAAWALSAFIKHHEYPTVGSSDFNEFSRLADMQDTALRLSAAKERG